MLSVRAGFIGRELSAAWPPAAAGWRLEEYDDGLFTHCFCAARAEITSGLADQAISEHAK